jgi:hypothetical protein
MSRKCSTSDESRCPSGLRVHQPARPLFPLGRIVATQAAFAHLEYHGIAADLYLKRHVTRDWGIVPTDDARATALQWRTAHASCRVTGRREDQACGR